MPPSPTVALRQLRGQGLRPAAHGLTLVRARVRHLDDTARALAPEPKRRQSTWSTRNAGAQRPREPARPSRQTLGRALRITLSNLAVIVSPRGIRAAFREAPASTSFSLVMLILLLGFGAAALRTYFKAFHNAQLRQYPDHIANTLRYAIYYTSVKPDPEQALKYYKLAMEQCAEAGLDPFSDQVLGIRFQVAHWLEQISNHQRAIEVLESVVGDCKKWVGVMEQCVRDGQVDSRGRYAPPVPVSASAELPTADGAAPAPEAPEAPAETLWRKRQRLLAKAIGTSVKLGELYSDEHVLDPDKAHAHLIWAVETSLNEFRRRATEGIKPGEVSWLSPEELGSEMESLGRNYERRSQFHLAIPLFFEALRLCESPCHRAVIMNNLSAAFAQHPIYSPAGPGAASATAGGSLQELLDSTAPATRGECLDAALNWARNAHAHAQDVQGDARTAECDEACAVALCNWADVAAMLGKVDVARAKYRECIDVSRKMEFAEGVKQAQTGLAKLTSTPSSQV